MKSNEMRLVFRFVYNEMKMKKYFPRYNGFMKLSSPSYRVERIIHIF